jgi:nucleotide-binding universal stress UspA family protein
MEIGKILFPTDFSVTTSHTAAFAADLARKYGAKVYILHVIYDIARDSGWYAAPVQMDSVYDDIKNSAREEMERVFSETFRGDIEVERVIQIGIPHSDILKFSEEKSIDLIVIGSHGRKRLDRVLFGSTVQRVLRRARCHVLTVRERG